MRSLSPNYTIDQLDDAFKTASETPSGLSKTTRYKTLSRPQTNQTSKIPKDRLMSHKLVLAAKSEARKHRENKVLEKVTIENTMRKEIDSRLKRLLRMETASITIQKHIRGYLARKKYDKKYIEFRKLKINRSIDSLKTFSLAARIIQRAYKRYKVRCKIEKLKHMFKVYVQLKKQAAEQKIQKVLPYFLARLKIKETKREKFRLYKIEEFRRNRAADIIRRYFNKIGFSYKMFMKKVALYKQRIDQGILKQAILSLVSRLKIGNKVLEEAMKISGSPKTSQNTSPKVNTGIRLQRANTNIDSDFTTAAEKVGRLGNPCKTIFNLTKAKNSESESPVKEIRDSMQIKEDQSDLIYDALQDIYRIRLEQTKTAYGIRDLKITKVKPILNKIEIESDIIPTAFSRLFPMFAIKNKLLDRMKPILPDTPKKDTLNESFRHSRLKRKPTVCVEECSYMKVTQATKNRLEFPELGTRNKFKKFINSSNRLLSTTISYNNKRRMHDSPDRGDRKPFTVSARKDPEFMPVSRQSVSNKRAKRFSMMSAGVPEEYRNSLDMNEPDQRDTIRVNPFKTSFRAPIFEYKKIRVNSAAEPNSYFLKDFI